MFSFSHMLIVGLLALIFIGPEQLPEVARSLAKLINELKHALGDVTGSFTKNKNTVDDWMKDLSTQIANATKIQEPVKENKPQQPQAEPEKRTMASATIEDKKKDS